MILKICVKVTEYNIRSDAILWRISTSIKVIRYIFTLALTVSGGTGHFTETAFHRQPFHRHGLSPTRRSQTRPFLCTWVFGRRPNCNRVRICVLGFSANRILFVSRSYIFEVPAIGSGRPDRCSRYSRYGRCFPCR